MKNVINRSNKRKFDQIRNIKISFNSFGYAAGSVLFELGDTKVLCAVSMQQGVPHFLRGTGTGWLTAEYAMLPTAAANRIQRDSSSVKKNGRSVEISRLIGRSLRSITQLDSFGERTIVVDCDVLQADGGTRTACLTGAYLALHKAVDHWIASRELSKNILTDALAAISVGLFDGQPLLDLDFSEDSNVDADFNFVLTKSGKIIEMQGGAEKCAVSWEDFETMRMLARSGVDQLFAISDTTHNKTHVPLFSLKNRHNTLN